MCRRVDFFDLPDDPAVAVYFAVLHYRRAGLRVAGCAAGIGDDCPDFRGTPGARHWYCDIRRFRRVVVDDPTVGATCGMGRVAVGFCRIWHFHHGACAGRLASHYASQPVGTQCRWRWGSCADGSAGPALRQYDLLAAVFRVCAVRVYNLRRDRGPSDPLCHGSRARRRWVFSRGRICAV